MTTNRISPDPDRTWVDGILRLIRHVGYGPTTLLLCYSDRYNGIFLEYGDHGMSDLIGGLVFLVLGQMPNLVASLTLDSTRTYVMQGAPFTQETVSSIPVGGSMSPEGFLLPVMMLVVELFLLGLLAFAMVVACASRAAVIPLVMSCWMAARVMAGVSDVDVFLGGYGMIHEDRDNDANDGNDDERETSWKQ
ncbi:hypothetical protein Tco_0294013 [Tanacetum coccineum]